MFSSSMHAERYRPAEAGMMVPVVVLGAEHLDQAYRPPAGVVNLEGTEAFESALRVSLTP